MDKLKVYAFITDNDGNVLVTTDHILPGFKWPKYIGVIETKLQLQKAVKAQTGYCINETDEFPTYFVELLQVRKTDCTVLYYWVNKAFLYNGSKEEMVGEWIAKDKLHHSFNELIDGILVENSTDLLALIKTNLKYLKFLLNYSNDHWAYEDLVYRYYHSSYKAYRIQAITKMLVHEFQRLGGWLPLNSDFMDIVSAGTGISFNYTHNTKWNEIVAPQLEAFFHAKYFLEMMVKYGETLDEDPQMLTSGWASVLYLYNMR